MRHREGSKSRCCSTVADELSEVVQCRVCVVDACTMHMHVWCSDMGSAMGLNRFAISTIETIWYQWRYHASTVQSHSEIWPHGIYRVHIWSHMALPGHTQFPLGLNVTITSIPMVIITSFVSPPRVLRKYFSRACHLHYRWRRCMGNRVVLFFWK